MRELTVSSAWSTAIPHLRSWPLVIAAITMLSVAPIDFNRHFDGLKLSLAEAASQCAAQPVADSRCPQAACIKAGPCYAGIFYQARGCLRWRCTGKRR
jgi:hypothetical protein